VLISMCNILVLGDWEDVNEEDLLGKENHNHPRVLILSSSLVAHLEFGISSTRAFS
jgi:hypothetical protein